MKKTEDESKSLPKNRERRRGVSKDRMKTFGGRGGVNNLTDKP